MAFPGCVRIPLLLLAAAATGADGHAILTQPIARRGQAEGVGKKIPGIPPDPNLLNTCGGEAGLDPGPGPITAILRPGTDLAVQYEVTIGHPAPPGVRIAIRYNDGDSFEDNVLTDGGGQVVVDDDGNDCCATNGPRTITVALPADNECEKCQIQWSWVSTSDGGSYVACADVELSLTKEVVLAIPLPDAAALLGGAGSTDGIIMSPVPILIGVGFLVVGLALLEMASNKSGKTADEAYTDAGDDLEEPKASKRSQKGGSSGSSKGSSRKKASAGGSMQA